MFCIQSKLVNNSKTIVLVNKRYDQLARKKKWNYNGTTLETVNVRIYFNNRLYFYKTAEAIKESTFVYS